MDLGIDSAPGSVIAAAAGSPALRSYQESQVLTASREQLLLLTYDGVLRFLARARRGLERSDYHEKHVGLSRAQALIIELGRTLDFTAAPELAESLARIYGFLVEELARADANDDGEQIGRVMELVAELRATWAEALAR